MKISAIIATYNRSAILSRAIDSLLNQTLSPGLYEIIIVDNGSTDNTRTLVEKLIADIPHYNLRYVFEPERGSSAARNRGAKEAHAKIIAFLDDDATASSEWLQYYIEGHAEYPQSGVIGGPIIPVYEGARPTWFTPELDYTFAKLDYGNEPRILDQQVVYEGNMSVRHELFFAQGGFSHALGRHGNDYIGHEGEALQRSLWKIGHKTAYLPGARILHHIYPERITRSEVCWRWYGSGRTSVMRRVVNGEERLARTIYLKRGVFHLKRWISDPAWWRLVVKRQWFQALYKACGRLGEIQQEIALGLRKNE
jgi:glycosyltransferase involved in cell wall biosynthesis